MMLVLELAAYREESAFCSSYWLYQFRNWLVGRPQAILNDYVHCMLHILS